MERNKLFLAVILAFVFFAGCITVSADAKQSFSEDGKSSLLFRESVDIASSDFYSGSSFNMVVARWVFNEGFYQAMCNLYKSSVNSCSVSNGSITLDVNVTKGYDFNSSFDILTGKKSIHLVVENVPMEAKKLNQTALNEELAKLMSAKFGSKADPFVTSLRNQTNPQDSQFSILSGSTFVDFKNGTLLGISKQNLTSVSKIIKVRYTIELPQGFEIKKATYGGDDASSFVSGNVLVVRDEELKSLSGPISIEAEKQLYPPYTPVAVLVVIIVGGYLLLRKKGNPKKPPLRVEGDKILPNE